MLKLFITPEHSILLYNKEVHIDVIFMINSFQRVNFLGITPIMTKLLHNLHKYMTINV